MKAIFLMVLAAVMGTLAVSWRVLRQFEDPGQVVAAIIGWPGQVLRNPGRAVLVAVDGLNAMLPGGWLLAALGVALLIAVGIWLIFFVIKPIERLWSLFGDRRRVALWKWNRLPARRKTLRHGLAAVAQPCRWWLRWQARRRHADRAGPTEPPVEPDGGAGAVPPGDAAASAAGRESGPPAAPSDASATTAGSDVGSDRPVPTSTDDAAAPAAAPDVQPVITITGPVMKDLSGDTREERLDAVRPGDEPYCRVRLTGTVNPGDLAAVFQRRANGEVSVFHPVLGGAAKPDLLRERLPLGLHRLTGLRNTDGHPMIEGLHVYWTDHDGTEHIDLLLRHTDGAHELESRVLQQAYQDVEWEWVSTSPLRILAADAARNPFPDPTWDGNGDNAIPAREAVDDPSQPAPPVIEVAVEGSTHLRRLLDFQRAANLPYVARQVGSRGRYPRDNMLSYSRVPDPADDETQAGDELDTGEFMAQVANHAADESVRTPVGVSVYTCYYCKHEKWYQRKEQTIAEGETVETRAQRHEAQQEGTSAERLVEERRQQQELHGEDIGRYGTRRDELELNTPTSHLMGMTIFDGGWHVHPSADVETALAGGQPPAASSVAPVCPPRGRTAVSVGHGAGELAKSAAAALDGGFYWVYTDPLEDLDSSYTRRQRVNRWLTLGDRLPGLGIPALTTERALTNLQKRWIRKPRWWGYKRNPTSFWPSHLTASEEVAVPFWPLDPDDSDALTDAARNLVRVARRTATEQEEAESGDESTAENADQYRPPQGGRTAAADAMESDTHGGASGSPPEHPEPQMGEGSGPGNGHESRPPQESGNTEEPATQAGTDSTAAGAPPGQAPLDPSPATLEAQSRDASGSTGDFSPYESFTSAANDDPTSGSRADRDHQARPGDPDPGPGSEIRRPENRPEPESNLESTTDTTEESQQSQQHADDTESAASGGGTQSRLGDVSGSSRQPTDNPATADEADEADAPPDETESDTVGGESP